MKKINPNEVIDALTAFFDKIDECEKLGHPNAYPLTVYSLRYRTVAFMTCPDCRSKYQRIATPGDKKKFSII